MIIYHLNFISVSILPTENDSPLSVNPNAVEARPIAAKSLKTITGWGTQIHQVLGCVEYV